MKRTYKLNNKIFIDRFILMPHKKIDFQVVFVSGEDEKHPSSELNSNKHGPLIQGWIAQK
jgi:hypothetical protein